MAYIQTFWCYTELFCLNVSTFSTVVYERIFKIPFFSESCNELKLFLNIFFCLASSLGRLGWYMLKWPIFQLFMNGRVKIVLQIQKIMKWQKNRGNEKNNLFAQWQKNMMWFLDYCPHCTMNTFGGSKIGNLNHKKMHFTLFLWDTQKKHFFKTA